MYSHKHPGGDREAGASRSGFQLETGLLTAVLMLSFLAAGALATGVGDVEVHLNGGDDVAYIGRSNIVEIWIMNDATLSGMTLGFEFNIGVDYLFNPLYGSHGYVNEEGTAVGCWDIGGLQSANDIDNVSPDHISIGGAAMFAGLPSSAAHVLCYTMDIYIHNWALPTAAGFMVSPYVSPPPYDWLFVDAGGNYAPTFYDGEPYMAFDVVEPVDNCEWQGYACNSSFYWPIPNIYGEDQYSMRFTPVDCCTLKHVTLELWDDYAEFDNSSGAGVDVIVYEDDGSGLPGTAVGSRNVPGPDLVFFPEIQVVDFSDLDLSFCDDFHIAYTVCDSNDNIAIISDDASCGANRSSLHSSAGWASVVAAIGFDVNFNIEAELCCTLCNADGDVNDDGVPLAVADMVYLIRYIYYCGPAPPIPYKADLNGDCVINVDDIVLFGDFFTFGFAVFDPYGGYPVVTCCDPSAEIIGICWEYWSYRVGPLGGAYIDSVDEEIVVSSIGMTGEDGIGIDLDSVKAVTVGLGGLDSLPDDAILCFGGDPTGTRATGCCQQMFDPPGGCSNVTEWECMLQMGIFHPGRVCSASENCIWILELSEEVYRDIYDWPRYLVEFRGLPGPKSGRSSMAVLPWVDSLGMPYRLEVYQGGQLIDSATCLAGEQILTDNVPPTEVTLADRIIVKWPTTVMITGPNGPNSQGDELHAVPQSAGPRQPSTYTDLHIRALGVGSFALTGISSEQEYECGDADGNGIVNVSDVVYILSYIFAGGPAPDPYESGDADCDSIVNVSDAVYLIAYIFAGGPPPCAQCPQGVACKLQGEFSNRSRYSAVVEFKVVEETKIAEVVVSADGPIAGVQMSFAGAGRLLQSIDLEASTRSKPLQLLHGVVDGMLRVGLIDLKGQYSIPAGAGTLFTVDLGVAGPGELELVDAVLVDTEAKQMQVTIHRTNKADNLPQQFSLGQNYPNPFNPETVLSYALPRSTEVTLRVYNIMGQTVRTLVDGFRPAGLHQVRWDGTGDDGRPVASGVYFYHLTAADFSDGKKMLLLK